MKDLKTTLTAVIGIVAWALSRKGIVLPPEIQEYILVATVGLIAVFAKDSKIAE